MAKLSLSLNTPADNNQGASATRISISKKVVDGDSAASAQQDSQSLQTKLSQPASAQSVISDGAASSAGTANPARSSSSDQDIEAIVAERMAQKVEKYNAKFQELRQQMEDLEAEKVEIQKKLNSTIQSNILIDEFFGSRVDAAQYQKRLLDVLNESLDTASDDNLPKFVVKFAKGWSVLQHSLSQVNDIEKGKPQLDYVCGALTYLLKCVSGCFVSERRTMLELVASHCSEYLPEYIFISPEHTLNIDPEIHNVPASGSTVIKESVSYAVIRSDTKKTVVYADVVTA